MTYDFIDGKFVCAMLCFLLFGNVRIRLVFDQILFGCVHPEFTVLGNYSFIDASATKMRGFFVNI